jgi:hypothetical protein
LAVALQRAQLLVNKYVQPGQAEFEVNISSVVVERIQQTIQQYAFMSHVS